MEIGNELFKVYNSILFKLLINNREMEIWNELFKQAFNQFIVNKK